MTQGKPGCELELWSELREIAERSTVSILVPELILLEFQAEICELNGKYEHWFAKIEKCVDDFPSLPSKEKLWNELSDLNVYVRDTFREKIEEFRRKKVEDSESRRNQVSAWLESPNVVRIPFDQDVFFQPNEE